MVDGGNQHLLYGAFRYREGIAEQAGVFQAADTSPDNGFLSTVVPVNSAEYFAAVASDDYLGEVVVTAESSILPIRAGVDDSTSNQFFLHLHENFTRNDCFMAVFHVELRDNSVIFDPLFCEEVNGVGLVLMHAMTRTSVLTWTLWC